MTTETKLNLVAFVDENTIDIHFSRFIKGKQQILKLLETIPEAEGVFYHKTYLNIVGLRCKPDVWEKYLQSISEQELENFKQALEIAKKLYGSNQPEVKPQC